MKCIQGGEEGKKVSRSFQISDILFPLKICIHLVTDNLKPSKHCAQVAQKANQVLGQITRAFHFRDSPLSDSINNMFAVILSLHPVSGIHGLKQIVMF